MNYEDFCLIFDEIVYSNYSIEKKYNYQTLIRDRPNNSFKFSESFLSFESYKNDQISITVYQDHILNKKISKNKSKNTGNEDSDEETKGGPRKEYIKPALLPVRIILGRKSLLAER